MSAQVTKAGPEDSTLADIAVPILLLHGRQDMFVSPGHGEWLAKHIPCRTDGCPRIWYQPPHRPGAEVTGRPGG